jgi:tRNA pseudouridine38-40 synthase
MISQVQRYFIYLSYNGTRYHGWQVQPNGMSIQQCLTDAINIFIRPAVTIIGAGRTDTGVHARLMVAHFDTDFSLDCQSITHKLNTLLPSDIAINKIVPVKPEAHARFSALSRTYKYYITTKKNPFIQQYRCLIPYALDFDAMNRVSKLLLKTTDFTSFSKLHSDAKTNICIVDKAEWSQLNDDEWVFTIRANRFLRNMVRAIVGTLLDLGRGKIDEAEFNNIITGKDRCLAGSSAPACGLFLEDISYPEYIFEEEASE